MARHRDFHNIDTEDFDEGDYGSSFSSYTDEVALSRSVEQEYIFRRGGTTPKMSQFHAKNKIYSNF